jgi:hypothetical protein
MSWLQIQMNYDRQADMLREAAHDRLVREALEGQPRREFYGPALARIGGWLVVWGAVLQSHYGEPMPKPTIPRKTLSYLSGR